MEDLLLEDEASSSNRLGDGPSSPGIMSKHYEGRLAEIRAAHAAKPPEKRHTLELDEEVLATLLEARAAGVERIGKPIVSLIIDTESRIVGWKEATDREIARKADAAEDGEEDAELKKLPPESEDAQPPASPERELWTPPPEKQKSKCCVLL